jgi:hypothetical protein
MPGALVAIRRGANFSLKKQEIREKSPKMMLRFGIGRSTGWLSAGDLTRTSRTQGFRRDARIRWPDGHCLLSLLRCPRRGA